MQDEPKFESTARATYYRVGPQQKGEKMPTLEGQPAPVKLLQKITEILNRCVFDQEDSLTYAESVALVKALPELTDPPAASEGRGLRIIKAAMAIADGMQGRTSLEQLPSTIIHELYAAVREYEYALQSVPSSPPKSFECGIIRGLSMAADYVSQHDNFGNIAADEIRALAAAPSDAGQPDSHHLNKASEFFDAWIAGHLGRVTLVQALANLTQAMEQRIRSEYAAPPALEKLRELEAKWRNRATSINALFPGDQAAERVEICADELHEIIATAPRPAEKD